MDTNLYELNDFLQKLNSRSYTYSDSSKQKCQTIKECLQMIETRVGKERIDVSAIRNVLHFAERGNAQGLDSTAIDRALEESRKLASCLQYQEQEDNNSRHSTQYASRPNQEALFKHGDNELRREIPNDASTSRPIRATRLSIVVGDKLTAGNTSFADLSDPNRPTRIAEQHRELYNDVWANALEELTSKDRYAEKKAVLELGNILKQTYEITKQLSKESEKSMEEAIIASLHNIGVPQSNQLRGHKADSTGTVLAHVQTIRRENVDMSIPQVQQKCLKEMKTPDKRSRPFVYHYATQCARLTWLMNIQDPPLILKWAKEGEPFQSQFFSEYTSRGTTVDFTTWPALFIKENGAILAKGIAQPKRK